MSRALPWCAGCRQPLAKRARITIMDTHQPGHPTVGWHAGCGDKLAKSFFSGKIKVEALIQRVLKRGGSETVSAGWAFWKRQGGDNG